MTRRWWKRLLVVAVALPLMVWGCDRVQMLHWVGSTDLEVEFVVTDAATSSSVLSARVEVKSDGGFYEEREKQDFAITADATGIARKVCRQSMCFGTRSGLGFTDTYVVHLPWWRFRVTADGFEPSFWTELDVPNYVRLAQRAGPRRAKLVVPVSLRRANINPAL